MTNPDGNPNIADLGVKFAAGDGRKRGGDKAWSIRNQVRYLAAQGIDPADPAAIKKLLGKNATVAQVIAAKALEKAAEGDVRAVEYATDNIDGKLIQPNLNADLAALQTMSEEELDAYTERLRLQLDESQDGAGIGIDGEVAPAGNADEGDQITSGVSE